MAELTGRGMVASRIPARPGPLPQSRLRAAGPAAAPDTARRRSPRPLVPRAAAEGHPGEAKVRNQRLVAAGLGLAEAWMRDRALSSPAGAAGPLCGEGDVPGRALHEPDVLNFRQQDVPAARR